MDDVPDNPSSPADVLKNADQARKAASKAREEAQRLRAETRSIVDGLDDDAFEASEKERLPKR